MAAHIQSGLATGNEGFVCFVCDAGVVGRYYTLATCRTQTTKVRLIEKLCQLLGDDYMVVISEEDVICRGCATMINSLDRLEKEVSSLRSIVLRYLEKKYEMGDGELVNARTNPPPSQPSFQPKTATKGSSEGDLDQSVSNNNPPSLKQEITQSEDSGNEIAQIDYELDESQSAFVYQEECRMRIGLLTDMTRMITDLSSLEQLDSFLNDSLAKHDQMIKETDSDEVPVIIKTETVVSDDAEEQEMEDSVMNQLS